ncbi:hypothetical protein N7527_012249 [Penicillium freii]|nr:hypothetical protein N7527_012249 [Penicillium freii]
MDTKNPSFSMLRSFSAGSKHPRSPPHSFAVETPTYCANPSIATSESEKCVTLHPISIISRACDRVSSKPRCRSIRIPAKVRESISKIRLDFPDRYWAQVDVLHRFPTELYEALAGQRWLGICLPQRYGGSELGISEAAVIMQTIAGSGGGGGGGGMTGASSIHMNIFGLEPVAKFGTEEQKE